MDLSKLKTVSSKIPEIDSAYIYKTNHEAKFTQRHQEGDRYRYKNHKAIMYAGEGEIYIYHQTVKIGDFFNGITLVTKDPKKTRVEKFFKETRDKIKDSEELTNALRAAKASPKEIGIYYTY